MTRARWRRGALLLSAIVLLAFGLVWAPDRPVALLAARWATPPSRFLVLDGRSVHVRDEGPRSVVRSSVRSVYGDPSRVTDSLVTRYDELTVRGGNRASLLRRPLRSRHSGQPHRTLPRAGPRAA